MVMDVNPVGVFHDPVNHASGPRALPKHFDSSSVSRDLLPLFVCPNSLAALVIVPTATQADCR